jgi:hypothetical protein
MHRDIASRRVLHLIFRSDVAPSDGVACMSSVSHNRFQPGTLVLRTGGRGRRLHPVKDRDRQTERQTETESRREGGPQCGRTPGCCTPPSPALPACRRLSCCQTSSSSPLPPAPAGRTGDGIERGWLCKRHRRHGQRCVQLGRALGERWLPSPRHVGRLQPRSLRPVLHGR